MKQITIDRYNIALDALQQNTKDWMPIDGRDFSFRHNVGSQFLSALKRMGALEFRRGNPHRYKATELLYEITPQQIVSFVTGVNQSSPKTISTISSAPLYEDGDCDKYIILSSSEVNVEGTGVYSDIPLKDAVGVMEALAIQHPNTKYTLYAPIEARVATITLKSAPINEAR